VPPDGRQLRDGVHARAGAYLMLRSVVRRCPMLLFDGHQHSFDGFTVRILRLRRLFLLQPWSRVVVERGARAETH
jgi:hypothetical protein